MQEYLGFVIREFEKRFIMRKGELLVYAASSLTVIVCCGPSGHGLAEPGLC